jgi:hypothetical protein
MLVKELRQAFEGLLAVWRVMENTEDVDEVKARACEKAAQTHPLGKWLPTVDPQSFGRQPLGGPEPRSVPKIRLGLMTFIIIKLSSCIGAPLKAKAARILLRLNKTHHPIDRREIGFAGRALQPRRPVVQSAAAARAAQNGAHFSVQTKLP